MLWDCLARMNDFTAVVTPVLGTTMLQTSRIADNRVISFTQSKCGVTVGVSLSHLYSV